MPMGDVIIRRLNAIARVNSVWKACPAEGGVSIRYNLFSPRSENKIDELIRREEALREVRRAVNFFEYFRPG